MVEMKTEEKDYGGVGEWQRKLVLLEVLGIVMLVEAVMVLKCNNTGGAVVNFRMLFMKVVMVAFGGEGGLC